VENNTHYVKGFAETLSAMSNKNIQLLRRKTQSWWKCWDGYHMPWMSRWIHTG